MPPLCPNCAEHHLSYYPHLPARCLHCGYEDSDAWRERQATLAKIRAARAKYNRLASVHGRDMAALMLLTGFSAEKIRDLGGV